MFQLLFQARSTLDPPVAATSTQSATPSTAPSPDPSTARDVSLLGVITNQFSQMMVSEKGSGEVENNTTTPTAPKSASESASSVPTNVVNGNDSEDTRQKKRAFIVLFYFDSSILTSRFDSI